MTAHSSIASDDYTNIKYENRNPDRATYVSASLPQLAKLLNEAASEGKTKEVSKLLANGASVHAFGPVGMNPLHLASFNGHIKVCEILLNAGVVIDSKNKVGKTALHLAAVNGHTHIVLQLLSLGTDVDPCDMLDMTPLHWACDRGHAAVVQLLLSYDADPSRRNKFQKTPLLLATDKKHAEVISLIQSKRKMEDVRPLPGSLSGDMSEDDQLENDFGGDSLSQPGNQASESDDLADCEEEPQILTEELTPQVLKEEIVGSDDIEDITNQVQKDLLYEDSNNSPERMDVDEESAVQDNLLKALDKLEDIVSMKNSHGELNAMEVTEAAEVLRAQAALISLEDPSRMLRRAIYYGQTIQLTEAGERALAMIRPDPFIIPTEEEKDEKNKSTSARSRQSSGNSECSAVVLRSQTIHDLVSGLASCGTSGTLPKASGPPIKRYKIL